MEQQLYIGVDVGKKNLDVFFLKKHFTIANSLTGIQEFIAILKREISNFHPLIICEATGGYEKLLVKKLREENIDIYVEHPNKVRAFAKSIGKLAKTDKIDAKIISEYGEVMRPKINLIIRTEEEENLADLVKRRDQLIQENQREKNRLDKLHVPAVEKSIWDHIKWMENEIDSINKSIDKLQKTNERISKKLELLKSVPSIGTIVAYTLIVYLPELGLLSHKEIAALAGVAPFNRESGSFRGKRFIQGGRSKLRKVLYMSAVSSIRWYPEMKYFYQRLRAQGKPVKVALTAIMRKLLMVLNSIVKRNTAWVEHKLIVS